MITSIPTEGTERIPKDHVEAFVEAIAQAGLPVPEQIEPDGHIHRFPTNGRRSDTAGYYCLFLDGMAAGHFGCWRNGIRQTWSSRNGAQLDRAEMDRLRRSMEKARAEREAYQDRRADYARQVWENAKPAESSHAYLMRKGVRPCGDLRQADIDRAAWFDDTSKQGVLKGCLLIPVEGPDGLQSLQFVTQKGEKSFMAGGKMAGGCALIPGDPSVLYECEGWATGASLHAATGASVTVAFTSGNLSTVAQRMKVERPDTRLVIAGDNDRKPDGSNPGHKSADAAAKLVGAEVAVPQFTPDEPGTDWNDFHAIRGLDAVREALTTSHAQQEADLLALLENHKACHLLASSPPPQKYVIEGLLPEPVAAAIVAPGSTGKSFWLMQLAACVATGTPFMGQPISRPGAVLMLGAEDDRDEMARRLHSITKEYEWDGLRLDPEMLGNNFYSISLLGKDNRLTVHDGRDIVREESRVRELIRMAQAIPDLRLIIIDPVSRFRSGDENDNEAATRFVEVLEQIREETGVTVLCAHHSRKGSTGEGADDIRGASAFVDALRFAATLAKPRPEKGLERDEADKLVRFNVVKSNYRTDISEQWMRRGIGGVLKPTDPPAHKPRQAEVRGQERYQESLPKLRELVRQKAEAGEPLTRRSIRQYAGAAGMFGMGDQNLRGMVNRAIEEGQLKLHGTTLHLW